MTTTTTPPEDTIRALIRSIPDFPRPGVIFRDITTLLAAPDGLRLSVEQMAAPYEARHIAKIVGLEARGFIFGGLLACRLGAGFVPVRKAGKLPGAIIAEDYALEYGTATFELHKDAITPGEPVLIVDDLLATGGSAEAAITLVRRLGGHIIGCSFVIDLPDLGGRTRLEAMGMEVRSLCAFAGD